jgi:hypothetical protein
MLVGLLGAALAMRLPNLEAYSGKFDEGLRAEQLFLMSAGFRPVRDIYAAQGPLSLDIFYPAYQTFGQTLAAARLGVVIYSLLGLLAAFWVGCLAAGRSGGFVAALLLLISPLYLKNSRLALVEVPMMALATLALGASLKFGDSGQRRWLVMSAGAFSLALLVKPLALAVALPIGLALLLRRGCHAGEQPLAPTGVRRRSSFDKLSRSGLDFLLFGAGAAAIGGLVVLLYGPEQIWEQVINYRARAHLASGWSLGENRSILIEELRDERLPLYVLAALSGLFVLVGHPRWGLPLTAWPLANLALLLLYSPLQFKHVVIMLPPLALLVGTALSTYLVSSLRSLVPRVPGHAGQAVPSTPPAAWRWFRLAPWLVLAPVVVWYLTSLPDVLREDQRVISGTAENQVESYLDETSIIVQLTGPSDFIIVDEPIVAFDSRRKVPPGLVDTSSYRIRSRAIGAAEVIEAAERHDVKLLFLFSNGLRDLKTFAEYVDDHYRAIKIYERPNAKDRALYLRADADLAAARVVLSRDLTRPGEAEFGGDLRLVGYNLGRGELRAGSSTSLTLHWEAIRPMAIDYHVVTHLRGPGGQPDLQSERNLGGGGEGTASWEAGRWVIRTQILTVPLRATAGDYSFSIAVYDSKNRVSPLLTAGPDLGSSELPLGSVRVRTVARP